MESPIITLTTDFGVRSPYVAQMKAVILSALPRVSLVDVTHAIPPQSIRRAEVILRSTAFAFPLGTVHLVVIDPGVGTARRPIAVSSRGLFFTGPDNGVLSIASRQPGARAVCLDETAFHRQPVSSTFHGRDIFAPVAAELAAGVPLEQFGSPLDRLVPTTLPPVRREAGEIRGETLAADDFGNLTTNIPASALPPSPLVEVAGEKAHWVHCYGEGPRQSLLSLVGSDGYLEIAVREGSAADCLGAGGTAVVCIEGPA